MAVQFIIGRSGTGKTRYCIDAISGCLKDTHQNQSLIFLVPEQASYQAEKQILSDNAGYHRLNVVSFSRLTFLLLGKHTGKVLSPTVKQMIINRILIKNKDQLKIFKSGSIGSALSRQMTEIISELIRSDYNPQDTQAMSDNIEDSELTRLKFSDISLVYREYLDFIENRYSDTDLELNRTRRMIRQAGFIKGAKLWVDGFAGFTASESAILAELAATVEDCSIALCMDTDQIDFLEPDPADMFYPVKQTYIQLNDIFKKYKIKLKEPLLLKKTFRFDKNKAIGHIEKNIFNVNAEKLVSKGTVRIIKTANSRLEVKYIARQIQKFARQGYRYRDIAVIASDLQNYQHFIRAYFEEYEIPFFIDKQISLNQHPLAGLLCSAIRAVTGGFKNSDVFAYLKSGLIEIDIEDIDMLENYCIAYGITSNDWTNKQNWSFASDRSDFDEEKINKIRKNAVKTLLKFSDNTSGVLKSKDFTDALSELMKDLSVENTIKNWIEDATVSGYLADADRHKQFCDKLTELLQELNEVFDDVEILREDYLSLLSCGLSQFKLASIPAALDQVLIGSIERSRHPDLKIVFLTGLTQNQFPSPTTPPSLLSDQDRICAGLDLTETKTHQLTKRQYLSYIAFTRPSDSLILSYPISKDDKAIVCSEFIEDIERLFSDIVHEEIDCRLTDPKDIISTCELTDLLCCELGKDAGVKNNKNELTGLLESIKVDNILSDVASIVGSSINYENKAHLESSISGNIMGEKLYSSATGLGEFAACPYKYFANRILGLKERQDFKLRPLDSGQFYHKALEEIFARLIRKTTDITDISNEKLLKLTKSSIEHVINNDNFITSFKNHRIHNEFIIKQLCDNIEDSILSLKEMISAGAFRPKNTEVCFGQKDTEYIVTLGNGNQTYLRGRIDRIDTALIDGESTSVIFDYKRKEKTFSWSDLYYGLDMQLAIYILAAKKTEPSCFLGAFYFPVEAAIKTANISQLAKEQDKFPRKAKGIFNGQYHELLDKGLAQNWSKYYNFYVSANNDQYGYYRTSSIMKPHDLDLILKYTEKKIIELSERILSGEISIRPFKKSSKRACEYCPYMPLCRFDWHLNDYNQIVSVSKPEVLALLETSDD